MADVNTKQLIIAAQPDHHQITFVILTIFVQLSKPPAHLCS